MTVKRFVSLLLFLLIPICLASQPVQAAGGQSTPSDMGSETARIDPALLKKFDSPDARVDFFIYMKSKADLSGAALLKTQEARGTYTFNALRQISESSQSEIRDILEAEGLEYRPYYIANAILAYGGTEALVYRLAGRDDVEALLPNRAFQLDEPRINPKEDLSPTSVGGNIAFVNADDVWAMGIDGAGIVLAANDTGLEWTHPALITHYRGFAGSDHNYNWWDPTGTYPDEPHDSFGHGTHVSGTMVGDDGFGDQIGMAPGAQVIHCKAMDDGGGGFDSWFLECFEWNLAPWDLAGQNPRPDLAPDAVNNSWGYWGGGNPVFEDAIANLQAAGILVEVSAGNEGPDCTTLRSPGDYSEVFTTGSVSWDQQSLPGLLTWFSSRGPSLLSPDFIPDLMAPGEFIRSAVPGGGYEYWDGTSMAGPHVVGLIALLWEANPALEGFIDATFQILTTTAVPLTGQTGTNCGGDYITGPNNDWGYGTIDSLAAVNAAMTFGGVGTLTGTVTDAATSNPLENVLITAELNPTLGWKTLTDSAGIYTRLVFSGTYTVTASTYSYYPQTATGIAVLEDTTTIQDFALVDAPDYTVSGTVTDALAGWPVYARIDITGYPYGPVFTDPETGAYSVDLAAGIAYTFNISSNFAGYTGQARSVGPLQGPQTEDFFLEADAYLCSAPGYAPGYAYFENFENGDGGYTPEGFGSWEWGVPTSGPGSALSGQNVWATELSGNYMDGEYTSLVSPFIDMSAYAGEDVIFEWWQWLVTEEYFDYASVEVSNDGGATWITLFGPISGTIDSNWNKYSVVLGPAFAVSNMQIRFNFQSDSSVTLPGFYIDDIGVGVVYKAPSLYTEDFEASGGSYSVSGVTSWEWGVPTKGPAGSHSGANAWATSLDDNYGNNEDGYLTSPVIDLTAASGKTMVLSWWQWLQTESGYDIASVEVFDGQGWVEMASMSGPIDWDWSPYGLMLDPVFAIANFQVRFRLQSDSSITYPGFYLDDVAVDLFSSAPPSVTCSLLSGGLAIGFVTDENTGSPLAGARVTGPAGIAATIATPLDPMVEDGFYTLFAPAGSQDLTAAYPKYSSITESPTIPLNSIVRQDFALPAALIAADPVFVSADVEMGETVTTTVDLNNIGGADTNFQISESPGSFTPAALNPVWVTPAGVNTTDTSYAAQSSKVPESPTAPFLYTVPAGAQLSSTSISVLLLAAAVVNDISSMLAAYPDLDISVYDARSGTPTLAELQTYDVVVLISNNPFADPYAIGNVLADYADSGGGVVQTVPTFFDPGGNGWGIQGRYLDEAYSPFIGSGDWFTYADLGNYDPTHPIMDGVTSANDYFRQIMDLDAQAEWVADWTDDEFIAAKGGIVALNTFVSDGYAWSGDIPLIVHNSILFSATGQDVPWLSTNPITGTLPAFGTVPLSVGLDAGVPEVIQPGIYQASLVVKNDGPYGKFDIPVTMTVNPPASWGRLAGLVTSLGYCDTGGSPISGAAVDILGLATTGTDPSGNYVYWLDSGTYTVTISADGHLPMTTAVEILAGQTAQLDADLRMVAPCAAFSAETFMFSQAPGTTGSDTLTIDNTGAGAYVFAAYETALNLTDLGPIVNTRTAAPQGTGIAANGPASVLGLQSQSLLPAGENLLSGWFGAADHPEGVIRYAFAQCAEQPESFYVIGGVDGSFSLSQKTWRFDAADNSWVELAQIPAGYEAPSAACYQGRIYVLGGSGSTDLQIYNIVTDTWSTGAPLPRGVEGAAVGAWSGKVYMAGGDDDFSPGSGVSDEVNIYDIATDTWTGNGSSMPVATGNAGFTQMGPYLYVVGGWGDSAPNANVTATQRYDMEADDWKLGPDFLSGRADFALASTQGNLFAIGGDTDGGFFFEATNLVEQLDLAAWPGADWVDTLDPIPVSLTANQAGFCTELMFNTDTGEVWSVGGLDTDWYIVQGRAFFRESYGEACYSIYTDVPWLDITPSAGSIDGDTSMQFSVLVDTAGLAPGVYSAHLAFVSNDPAQPLKVVTVVLNVNQDNLIYLPLIRR